MSTIFRTKPLSLSCRSVHLNRTTRSAPSLCANVLTKTSCLRPHDPSRPEQMTSKEIGVILKRFESPDEVRVMEKGKFELVHIGGMTIGRATYEPGGKWSEHVGQSVGAPRCHVEHVGLVLSGTATAAFDDGRVFELRAGEL